MSSKLVNHHQSTQSSESGHKCFDYNYKGNCLKSNCQYSHSCIRCAGMHPVINCNQTRPQPYTHNGQRTSQSSFRTNPISSSMSFTTANHSFGLQFQQQQWRPQHYQPLRFTYRATQNIWDLGKTPINKLVLKLFGKLSKQNYSKQTTIWVFNRISVALLWPKTSYRKF